MVDDIRLDLISDENEEYVFDVVVEESAATTEHRITFTVEYYEEVTDRELDPEEFVKKSFEFLLEREPKESVLGEFDLSEIEEYFPEYKEEIMMEQ